MASRGSGQHCSGGAGVLTRGAPGGRGRGGGAGSPTGVGIGGREFASFSPEYLFVGLHLNSPSITINLGLSINLKQIP